MVVSSTGSGVRIDRIPPQRISFRDMAVKHKAMMGEADTHVDLSAASRPAEPVAAYASLYLLHLSLGKLHTCKTTV